MRADEAARLDVAKSTEKYLAAESILKEAELKVEILTREKMVWAQENEKLQQHCENLQRKLEGKYFNVIWASL